MKQLVFIHGRSQQNKDASALKKEWLEAWQSGLKKNGLSMPIEESDIRFPYYGQTLYDLAEGASLDEAAAIVIKGLNNDDAQKKFIREVLSLVEDRTGITQDQILEVTGKDVLDKGVLNWEWVQGVLKAIDRFVPLASGTSIALATNDVYQYLDNISIRETIENGVRDALKPGVPTIVVSHSLGTIVSYNLLRREGEKLGLAVPLFVTLGSPLAVTAIRKKLAPNAHPVCVDHWFNAMDERDVVALYPLDKQHFPVTPEIENKLDIDNPTTNRHGISGYLSDPVVAKRIYDALT
jgi:hypothetical protein